MDEVQELVVPVKNMQFTLDCTRREQSNAIAELEVKLNKSYLMLTTEIDNLKEPMTDMIQDMDMQRQGMMYELERT